MRNENTGFDDAPDVVQEVFEKYRVGGVSDVRARNAIVSYVCALAPEDMFSEELLNRFEVYVDIALQGFKRAQCKAMRKGLSRSSTP
ncbi:hypothetical protein [Asticcacaulis sp. YBE204]|uniref:hypothetical protein n=1 Tax=Asticcacaulis sp. YBE204 TaxID=1282363 RepID=UPI0003C3D09C|nr:hypothetical protein [Asticcacaulis sp. YBE204]ESQ79198.1 hypothetical protein AEYBE204_09315 [Asticcacaulis sp. YBE204]